MSDRYPQVTTALLRALPLLVTFAGGSAAVAQGFADRVGSYVWVGRPGLDDAGNRLTHGVEQVAALGGRAVRLKLDPPCDGTYPSQVNLRVLISPVPMGVDDPPQGLAMRRDLQAALANPGIETYVLTIAGCNSTGHSYIDPALYADPATGAVTAEARYVEDSFRDFTLFLYRSFPGKRFILSNWEGDNVVYCCNAHGYALNSPIAAGSRDSCGAVAAMAAMADATAGYADYCRAGYPARYGIAGPEEGLRGFRLWLEARQRGVIDGRLAAARDLTLRRRAAARGLAPRRLAALWGLVGREPSPAGGGPGPGVFHAPEINIAGPFEGQAVAMPIVLTAVLPVMDPPPDLVSYSSYQTLNLLGANPAAGRPVAETPAANDLPHRVCADLAGIRDALAARVPDVGVILGELGYRQSEYGAAAAAHLTGLAVDAALACGASHAFTWQLFDDDYGLFDRAGKEQPLAACYRARTRGGSGAACALATGSGLRGEYFANVTLSGEPALLRTDPEVDFDWATGSPDPAIPIDRFSVRWTGRLVAPFTDAYIFRASSGGGVRLAIDGELVIDDWTGEGPSDGVSAPVHLQGGEPHDLRLEVSEDAGEATARLRWETGRLGSQAVPAAQLFPASPEPHPAGR